MKAPKGTQTLEDVLAEGYAVADDPGGDVAQRARAEAHAAEAEARTRRLVQEWRDRLLKQDRDVWLPIWGQPGDGKSTLAWNLGRAVDSTFTQERMLFSGKLFVHEARRPKMRGKAVVWDEVTEGGLGIRATSDENVIVLKHMVTSRKFNRFQMLCVPWLEVLTGIAREKRATEAAFILERGVARIYRIVRVNPLPGGQVFYKRIVTTRFGPIPGARKGQEPVPGSEAARYESRKMDWDDLWGRDSDSYLNRVREQDKHKRDLARLERGLSWMWQKSVPANRRMVIEADPKMLEKEPWRVDLRKRVLELEARAIA
jgi:hypothetical protein